VNGVARCRISSGGGKEGFPKVGNIFLTGLSQIEVSVSSKSIDPRKSWVLNVNSYLRRGLIVLERARIYANFFKPII
jgi:hypothetical protein